MVLGFLVLTPQTAPASNIAGIVLRHHGISLWQAGHLDGVAQLHMIGQLDEGNVVAGSQEG